MKEKNTYSSDFDRLMAQSKSAHINPFIVPSDFFEEQERNIQNLIRLENRVSKTSSTGFNVPDDYFEQFEENIRSRVREVDFEKKLKTSVVDSGFSTPSVYFNELEDDILVRIKEQELRKKITTEGFTTPKEYFEKVNQKIKEQIQNPTKQEAPIISFKKKKINWSKFSTAAIILIIGVGTLLSYFGIESSFNLLSKSPVSVTAVNLHNISDEDIVNYLTQIADNAEELLHLTQIVEDKTGQSLNLNSEMSRDEDIQEYLKYML